MRCGWCAEPMVEGWPFTVAYRHNGNVQNLSFQSNERLNLVVTPAAFRSLGDLRSFLQLLNSVPDPVCMLGSRTVARCLTQNWLGPSRAKMSTLYRSLPILAWNSSTSQSTQVNQFTFHVFRTHQVSQWTLSGKQDTLSTECYSSTAAFLEHVHVQHGVSRTCACTTCVLHLPAQLHQSHPSTCSYITATKKA